ELGLSVENCIVTTGSQQGLYILSDILLDPGDIVITSAPSYFVYTGTLVSLGADVRTVPIDEQGMRMDLLAELLERLDRAGQIERLKLIYVVSYYQNPSGISLSAERRGQLVELVRRYSRRHRILIVEDAAYRELRYDGPALPSIKSFDPQNEYVALAMTFSKPFSAGMKTGYLFLPDELVDPCLQQKGNHDFGSNNLVQHLLHRAMTSGAYLEHVERVRQAYIPKRDAMLQALERDLAPLGEQVSWTRPAGGLYVWLTLPAECDTRRGGELFNRCIAKGVLYVPGDYCFAPQPDRPTPTNHMRLSFGVVEPAAIREGVRRLAEAILEQFEQHHRSRPARASKSP
ncbi:MAG: PLP-dependent aminotransferase family protein, partial [Phycisphaerae bacterium]